MHDRPVARRRAVRRRGAGIAVAALAVLGATFVPAGATSAAPGGRPAAGVIEPGFGEDGIPARPAAERYVRDAYRGVLLRGIDEPGLTYWGGLIDEGYSRNLFARNLTGSGESLRWRIVDVYARTLERAPTSTELTRWTNALRYGTMTPEYLLVDVLGSQEFTEDTGGEDADFLNGVYRATFGRAIDSGAAAYWQGRLDAGLSRRDVAREIVLSNASLRAIVADAFDRILGRAVDTAGRDFWVQELRRHGSVFMDKRLLGSGEVWTMGCSVLDGGRCLLPFPNDQLTIADATTDTGRRVAMKPAWVPAPTGGPAFDPTEWNRQDGFSPGSAILLSQGAIDPTQSGLPPLTDIGASLEADSPIYVVDLTDGTRWPVWAEVDTHAPAGPERALVIRPARNFLDGHRYAVGIGPMRDGQGQPIEAPAAFKVFRDELPTAHRRVEEQRASSEEAIAAVVEAGMDRSTLHLAWTFTVASTRNLAERIIHMRDETLDGPAGAVPADFTVTGSTYNQAEGVTRVDGTFEVPLYLTGDGTPGNVLEYGDDWLPERNGTWTAPFTCSVPDSASQTPARAALYGHGLLGTGSQANSGYVRAVAREHNIVFCGTDWSGMSASDFGNIATILQDLSQFPELADRTQQGLLNFLVLGRLMTLADGLVDDPAFQDDGGEPLIDTAGGLHYYGLSQGGIMGGALVAVSDEITRGVLGVPGMNYSTLLERSVDFDPFFDLLAAKYSSPLDRIIMLGVIQMQWDRGEANGYANHVTADPLPGTPASEVLLQVAYGDHQVSQFAADVMARTYGAATNDPPLAPGRLPGFVEPLWGIERIETWPHAGSAITYWDSGTPVPPYTNQPPREGEDPHGDPRSDPDARVQISEFLKPDGVVVDVCEGTFCTVDFQ